VSRAGAQLLTEALRQAFQFCQRLWAGQTQGHLPRLIEVLVEIPQCLLKRLTFHRQAVAIARMEAAQRMIGRQALQQRDLLLRVGVLGPGDELRVQHFALAQLIVQRQARMGQQIGQAFEPIGKGRQRQFNEEIRGAFAGAGIDLATVALHVGHQPFIARKTLSAKKQQMFQKVRQAGPRQRHVMAAGRHPQNSGATL